jgi:NADH-quinone oxidoreductase subunit J
MIEFLFYIFASVLIGSAAMVLFARHPVHAVLFLIVCFFNAGAIFILAGAEFLGMMLVIVYVGAVAVLFLFVVMMLDVDFAGLKADMMRQWPLGLLLGMVLLLEIGLIGWSSPAAFPEATGENTRAIGRVLYTEYFLPFQVSGLLLLVAMTGAIVLTLRHKPDVKRQQIGQQLKRDPKQTVILTNPKTGEGVG